MIEQIGTDLFLLDRLAAGGMAEVYLARQMGTGGFEKTVAVKRVLKDHAADESFKEMFREEANLCAQLQHANIAQVYSNGEFEDYLYLVMEFIDGKNLKQLFTRAQDFKIKIPIDISCHIISEVAKGLGYAHNFKTELTDRHLGLVHRDISPHNVLISYEGGVKIVDFGIAKMEDRTEKTTAGSLKGKFAYMSPEQAQGKPVDLRTDIFALGIVFYELLTQERLFAVGDEAEILAAVKSCSILPPSALNHAITPQLENIVLKALAAAPDARYQSAAEMFSDVQAFMVQQFPGFLPQKVSSFVYQLFGEDLIKEKERRKRLVESWRSELAGADSTMVSASRKGDTGSRSQSQTQTPPSDFTQSHNADELADEIAARVMGHIQSTAAAASAWQDPDDYPPDEVYEAPHSKRAKLYTTAALLLIPFFLVVIAPAQVLQGLRYLQTLTKPATQALAELVDWCIQLFTH